VDAASLGDRELDVMTVLWQSGSGTVTEVQEALGVPLAYTTVLTILRNLEAKGFLRRAEEGRAHRYFPKVKRRAEQRRALTQLLDTLFGGSPEALIAQLVDDHDLSPKQLKRMAKRLANPSGDEGGKS
jgi:BlaI family penicillinase repressor